MNIFSLFSLFSSILAILIGYSVYRIDHKRTQNLVFIIFTFLLAFWCFAEFGVRDADTLTSAYFWMKLEFIWPFATVLTLHFALLFTEKIRTSKNHFFLGIILYVPAAIFSLIYLMSNLIIEGFEKVYWGYSIIPAVNVVHYLSNIWAFSITFFAIYLCAIYYLKTKDILKKKQAKFVTFGFFIPVIVALVTYGVFPILNLEFPETTTISTMFLSLFVGFAITKYKLFNLTPSTAAETIISTMSDPLVLTNAEGQIVRVNKAFEKFLNLSENELKGKSFLKILNELNITKSNKILEKEHIKNKEIAIKTNTSAIKSVQFTRSNVIDKDGQLVGLIYVFHDITELKNLQKHLIKSERFIAIGELAGLIGHDLRNPLSGITNATYLLKKKNLKFSDETGKEIFQIIENCIDHSNKIINDLLEYSRDIRLCITNCSIENLIDESLQMIEIPKHIQLIKEIPEEITIEADSEKIKRIFTNLIKNAIDAMPIDGKLVIRSTRFEDKIVITFQDNGVGIEEETMKKLFVPLSTTKAQGMGFGLAICRRFIESHKGTINVNSTYGEGSTFTIEIPVK